LSFAHAQWKARYRVYEELGYEIFDVYDPAPDE